MEVLPPVITRQISKLGRSLPDLGPAPAHEQQTGTEEEGGPRHVQATFA